MKPAILLTLVLFAPSGRAKVWAVATPDAVAPGGVFQVKAGDTDDASVTATVRFQGLTSPLMPVRGVLRALVGVYAGTKPGEVPLAVQVGGREIRLSVRVKPRYFPSQNVRMQQGKTSLMDPAILARERETLNDIYGARTPEQMWASGFVVPAAGPATSAWGRRRTVNGRPWGQHQGADIRAPEGAVVSSANSGRIALARRLEMRGNTVVIDHGLGVFSVYCHLSRIDVTEGAGVSRGQRLGLVGSTGFSSGPHLHWEIRIGRVSVDPWPIVKNGIPLG